MSREHLLTTPPTLTRCTTCRATVLAAVITGLERHIDTSTLNPAGMLQAVNAGIPLFLLRGGYLYRLTTEHLTAGRADIVLPGHTCRPIPDRFIDGPNMGAALHLVTTLLGATPVEPADTPPPF